jgi:hypothetical protein
MHLFQLACTCTLFLLSKEHGRSGRSCQKLWAETKGAPTEEDEVLDSFVVVDEAPVDPAAAAKYEALLKWLRAKDAVLSDKVVLRPSSRGGGFGAFLTQPAIRDELLFSVPRAACMTLKDATDDERCGRAFQALIEKAGPGGNTVVLAGFMARERLKSLERKEEEGDDDSAYGPYLATLPWERGMNNQEHILYWTDDDVESKLKGSFCYEEAKDLRSEVSLAIKVLDGIVGKSLRGDEGGFKWPWKAREEKADSPYEGLPEAVTGAFVSILTRAFEDGDAGSDEEKMVPLLDMLQHSDEPNVSHIRRKEDGSVEVRARRHLEAGEELLNQYRSEREETMPYHRFFTRFGFVPGIQEPIENLLGDKSSIFFAQKAEI